MYDKDEDGEFLRRPRQCLPIAYVMLKRAPPILQPLLQQPIAIIRDKAPNAAAAAAANDEFNSHATTKGSSVTATAAAAAQAADGFVRNRRAIKAKGKRREKRMVAWQLIPVDAKNTPHQKLLKSSNRQKIPKPCQKRPTLRKLKEDKDSGAAAAAAAAAAQDRRVASQNQATSKGTTTEICRSIEGNRNPSRQENRIGFETNDKSRLWKIPLTNCSQNQQQPSQPLSADASNSIDQCPLIVAAAAKTVSWSTSYKPGHITTALDPRRRQQPAAKESTSIVCSPKAADDFSLRSPSNDSASAALRLTNDSRIEAVPKTPSGGRRTCLIDALPMPSPPSSLAPSVASAAGRSKQSVAGGRDVSKTRKASCITNQRSSLVSRTLTGIDSRSAFKQILNPSSDGSLSSNASNTKERQRTELRSTAAAPSSSSSASFHFQTDSSTDASLKSRDIPHAQRAAATGKTSSDGETHSKANRTTLSNGHCTAEAAGSNKHRAFPTPPPLLLPPPPLPPPPPSLSVLSVVNENQSAVAVQFSSSRTASFVGTGNSDSVLRFPAQNETQVVDLRNFSFDGGSRGASRALICSTISMRTEFRRDQSEMASCPPLNGQLNSMQTSHHSAGQTNLLLHGLDPAMALHPPPHHSIASSFTNDNHQQQQQQQKLLMLQRGFISSITKQLASDLNDVANVLRNSKQQKTTTDAEKTASGFLREINCRFMELGPVCAQYKQLFRCLPEAAGPLAVALPDCRRLYEHEQILKNCCDSLGKAFGELKSHHLQHLNQSEQKSRTYAWLLSKKTVLCNCIDALKRVLDSVVLECAAPCHRDAQKSLPNVISDKTSAVPCTASLEPCSSDNNDLPVTSSSDLTVGRDPKAISEHSTTDIENASFDCDSQQTLVYAADVEPKDSNEAFDCVEFDRSQRKSLLDNDIEPEEKEQRKEQERELEISSSTEENTLRKYDSFTRDPTESTSQEEEGNRHEFLSRKSCSVSSVESASELKQISLDFNANESLRSDVNQKETKERNPESAAETCFHHPIETNGTTNEAGEESVVDDSALNKNDETVETEEGSLINTDAAAATERCVSVEPNPSAESTPDPLERGTSSALISIAQSASNCVSRNSDFLPIVVKIEREDEQHGGGGGVCNALQPSHTIIFDADDFNPPPPSSNDTTGPDDWLSAHLTWEKKPIPVSANPRMEIVPRPNDDEDNENRVAVKGTAEGDQIPPPPPSPHPHPPLLTPSCAFDPKERLYCVKFDADEPPPVLEANDSTNISKNPADDRFQIHDSSVDSAVVCKPSSAAGPIQGSVRRPGDLAGEFCFGRIVGEMILPKDDAGNKSVFGGKMERCFSSDDVTSFDERNPPIARPADGLSVSDDVKGLLQATCLSPEVQSGVGQFDCGGYDLCFKDDDGFETPFVLTIKPDDDFDPDSVCFLESQTTEADDIRPSASDGKNEWESATGSFQRGENLTSDELNRAIGSHENSSLAAAAAEDPLIEIQMDASSTEPGSETVREASDDASDGRTSDRSEAAVLPSSGSPRGTADSGRPLAPLSVSTSTSMTVFSESPESPSPESNAVCPSFHGIINAAAAAARSEMQLKEQATSSRERKRRQKHIDQKSIVVKAKEEKCSVVEQETEKRSKDEDAAAAAAAARPPPPPQPTKVSYVPSWSQKMSNCAAAGQELRTSFIRFVAFQSSLLNSSSASFKAKAEKSNRTENKSFINNEDKDKDSEKRKRDEKHRLDHDDPDDRKIERSDESRRSTERKRRRRRSNSGAGRMQDSWHRRSSKTSSRGTEDSEYEIKHLDLLRNERQSNRWSSDRSSNPRRGCSSKGVSSPDRTRFPETRQRPRDSVRLRSPFERTRRSLSRSHSGTRDNRSRDDYYARRRTAHHHFGGSEETRWRRSEVKVHEHRRSDCSSIRRCDDDDDDRSYQKISDPSKLKRQFWSRGHPRFRCHDGCGQCPPATDDAAAAAAAAAPFAARPSSGSCFLPHSHNKNDVLLEETLLVNLRATRTDVSLAKDDDDDDDDEEEEEEEEKERAIRRRTVKREREEEVEEEDEDEERRENGRRRKRSKTSSSNHGSEQKAKKRKKKTKKKTEKEDRRTMLPVGKSRTLSSSTADQPMTPTSSSNCGSDYAHLPRRTVAVDPDSDFDERRTAEGHGRQQTRLDQVAMRSPLHDAGATGARPGVVVVVPSRVAAPTYVTEVLKTKNFSTEVSFERFKS